MLCTFFARIIDWDYPDAPRRVAIFTGDLPKADEPTPKFLDDPSAAKFMAALATDPNRLRRLIVELLARTGMRAGELGGLRDDAAYRLGDTHWLRIPVSGRHNDRSVPLHPLLVGLISDYRAWRGPTSSGLPVERDDHQPFDRRTGSRPSARASASRPAPSSSSSSAANATTPPTTPTSPAPSSTTTSCASSTTNNRHPHLTANNVMRLDAGLITCFDEPAQAGQITRVTAHR
jgi:integrase